MATPTERGRDIERVGVCNPVPGVIYAELGFNRSGGVNNVMNGLQNPFQLEQTKPAVISSQPLQNNGRFTTMTTLAEIETAIQQLPPSDVHQLMTWLQSYANDFWDQQIESDLQSGRLDGFIAKAEADITAHRIRDLDEVIHHA